MNPNSQQALEDEEAGDEELEEDIDYDAVYGGLDIDISDIPKTKEIQHGYAKIFGDVAKQATKETLIGLGGTWGDITELAGMNPNLELPGQRVRSGIESDILDKMNQPGYKPSLADLQSLSDDELVPQSFGLPTSKNLRDINESIGGPGEPETTQGRYAGRIGNLYGSGASVGQINPIPAVAAGVVGQTIEEKGGGPVAQTIGEIATLLATQGRGTAKSALNATSKKDVADKINNLRKLGYTDEQITLAINAASQGKKGKVTASKGSKTQKAFEGFAEKSDEVVNDILSSEVKGFEKGAAHVKELANEAYGQVIDKYGDLRIKNLNPFVDSMNKVFEQVKKVIGNNSEAKNFVGELTKDVKDIVASPTAEDLIYFYQRLNGMGKWVKGDKKDRLIKMAKNSVKDTFEREGTKGKALAEDFDKVNKGVQRSYKAADVRELIDASSTQSGLDYNKLSKVFDKPENVQLFEEVLGPTQAKNVQQIAKVGKEVKDFDKSWKATNFLQGKPTHDLLRTAGAAYFVYQQDWDKLALVAGTKAMGAASRKLAEKSLTDPKMQNILIRGLHAIKNKSPQAFRSANQAMQKYVDEEGIDIQLD